MSEESKYAGHTPGPWRVKDNDSLAGPNVYGPAHPVDGGDYAPLAGYRGGALSVADARLIADAPRLLEERDAAVAFIRQVVEYDHARHCDRKAGRCVATCVNGRAVLALVEGRK